MPTKRVCACSFNQWTPITHAMYSVLVCLSSITIFILAVQHTHTRARTHTHTHLSCLVVTLPIGWHGLPFWKKRISAVAAMYLALMHTRAFATPHTRHTLEGTLLFLHWFASLTKALVSLEIARPAKGSRALFAFHLALGSLRSSAVVIFWLLSPAPMHCQASSAPKPSLTALALQGTTLLTN